MTKRDLRLLMLKLRRTMLYDVSFERLRGQIPEAYAEHEATDILESFGEWVQTEIDNIDARIARAEKKAR